MKFVYGARKTKCVPQTQQFGVGPGTAKLIDNQRVVGDNKVCNPRQARAWLDVGLRKVCIPNGRHKLGQQQTLVSRHQTQAKGRPETPNQTTHHKSESNKPAFSLFCLCFACFVCFCVCFLMFCCFVVFCCVLLCVVVFLFCFVAKLGREDTSNP